MLAEALNASEHMLENLASIFSLQLNSEHQISSRGKYLRSARDSFSLEHASSYAAAPRHGVSGGSAGQTSAEAVAENET